MIAILNAEPEGYNDEARTVLAALGTLHEESCDRERLLALIPDFEVLIVRLGHRVDAELLAAAPRLRIVVTATTGLNHVDLDAARQHGVAILCLKGERAFLDRLTATAELTWALLLAVMRRLPEADRHVRQGCWQRDLFRGRQLTGKTLGIIGLGRLGSIVADYGRVFRMRVQVCDPYVEDFPDWVEPLPLPELLATSDVVSLHVNLEPETTGMLDAKTLAHIKSGAVLINTARGELIDEQALVAALGSGQLAGAGLDVLSGEALGDPDWPRNNPVWRHAQTNDTLVLSPHIGGATMESMADAELFMANKLQRHLDEATTA